MAALSLIFDILAKDNASKTFHDVGDAAEDAGKKGSKFGTLMSGGAKLAGAAALAGGTAIVAGFAIGIKAAIDYEKITARTANVLKSTGGVAGVTAKQIAGLGGEIEGYSAFTNDAIESGANLLLTFTNIRNEAGKGNDIFNQSTKIMADMSAALGQDTATSATQLGKALNDPIRGVSALSKVGVAFTEDQKAQIKTLQESGDLMGAQKIILAELSNEYGGAAKAAGKTFAGSLTRLKNQFGDLLRDAVMPLLPAMTAFVGFLADKLPAGVKIATAAVGKVTDAVKKVVGVFKGADAGGGVGGFFTRIGAVIEASAPIIQHALAVVAVALWAWIAPQVVPALKALGDLMAALGVWIYGTGLPMLGGYLAQWGAALWAWIGPMIVPALVQLALWAGQLVDWVAKVGLPLLLGKLIEWGSALVDWITPMVGPLLGKLGEFLGTAVGWLIGTGLPLLIGALVVLAYELIAWVLPQLPGLLGNLLTFIGSVVSWLITTGLPTLAKGLWDMASSAVKSFWEAIEQSPIYEKVEAVFSEIPGKIADALSNVAAFIAAPFISAYFTIKEWVDKIVAKAREIKNAVTGQVAVEDILGPLPSGATPDGARANGGPVTAGRLYQINERGLEGFIPNVNGTVVPANVMAGLGGSNGDVVAAIEAQTAAINANTAAVAQYQARAYTDAADQSRLSAMAGSGSVNR